MRKQVKREVLPRYERHLATIPRARLIKKSSIALRDALRRAKAAAAARWTA